MRRRVASVISVVAILVVLLPAWIERDSYPLSTYPMFSYRRDRVATIDTAVGYEVASGARVRLNPTLIAGGIEVIHAAVTVSTAIEQGDTDALCHEIAARAVARRPALARIEVVSETHDVVDYFAGESTPQQIVVHSSCDVPR
jgi:hypothetical protein